jgi:hypothetical protein
MSDVPEVPNSCIEWQVRTGFDCAVNSDLPHDGEVAMRPHISLLVAMAIMGWTVTALPRFPINGGNGVEGIERVTPSEHVELSLQVLLEGVCAWLVTEFDLPAATKLPTVMIVPPVRMAALRYHGLAPTSSDASDFIALCDGWGRTIYLPEGWRGATAAEVSILVHEMVHYLQDMAGQRFECVEQEERLAYAAQDRWLVLAGSSLEREFGIDAFTVLARSTCLH